MLNSIRSKSIVLKKLNINFSTTNTPAFQKKDSILNELEKLVSEKLIMKIDKIIRIILAIACCFSIVYFLNQAVDHSESYNKSEAKSHYLSSAKINVENSAICQPLFEISFSFDSNKNLEIDQFSLWHIHQRLENSFMADSGYLRYSISYFIQSYKTSLIFPFHHFW